MEEEENSSKGVWKRLKTLPSLGVLLGILSSFSFSVAIMLVKVIRGVDPMFFVMARGVLQLFLFNAVGCYQGLGLRFLWSRSVILYLLLTGVLGSSAQALAYGSLAFIPLGDATAIILSAPVFVSFFACILLKERCGPIQVVTVLIAVAGVILICRPTFLFGGAPGASDHLTGTCMVAAGCVALAGLYVALRKITHLPAAMANSSLGLSSILVGLSVLSARGSWHLPVCGTESALMVVSACAGTAGMLFFVCATKVEDAGPLSVVRTSEIVFAFVWQTTLLGQTPSWTTVAGAAAIVSSVLLTALHKWVAEGVLCMGTQWCAGASKHGAPDKSTETVPMKDSGAVDETQC